MVFRGGFLRLTFAEMGSLNYTYGHGLRCVENTDRFEMSVVFRI